MGGEDVIWLKPCFHPAEEAGSASESKEFSWWTISEGAQPVWDWVGTQQPWATGDSNGDDNSWYTDEVFSELVYPEES